MQETVVHAQHDREGLFLETLCRDYTAVYFINLLDGEFEIIKLDGTSNARPILDDADGVKHMTYPQLLDEYTARYIYDHDAAEFRRWLGMEHLKELLGLKERVTYRYQSIPNIVGQQYFEVQAIRMTDTEDEFGIILGFRYIDDIIAVEQQRQLDLKKALMQANLNNEIISAISRIYISIFRIDLARDYYDEVSSEQEVHWLTGNSGRASSKMIEICDTFVADEYHDAVLRFFDLKTLPERLKDEDTVAIEYHAKDGNWHLARFITKKKSSDGMATHVLYVTRIISDTKRREQSWIAIAEEANRSNIAKTEFLSQMAHNLRTPVNAICGFAEIANADIADTDKVKKGLEQITRAARYLEHLIDDVLDITGMERGQLRIKPEPVSISEIFSEYSGAVDDMHTGKNLSVECRIHDIACDKLMADPLRIRQIYMNLLSNSIKYTPDGGRVYFEVYEEEGEKGVKLVSLIKDTGIGMSAEYMEHMYDRFSRAVDTRVNKINGNGLGLSIVKELVDMMGGTISAESAPGEGTTFRVELELERADNNNTREEQQEKQYSCDGKHMQRKLHLLVAEDNDINYEIAEQILLMNGITCERAEDGAVCVEMIMKASPGTYDAILMDMQMPVMDGVQASQAIRHLNTPDAAHIPIIAVTANAYDTDIVRCAQAGMNAHLTKPLNSKLLVSTINKYI